MITNKRKRNNNKNKELSKEEEEAKSQAFIQQLLAKEQGNQDDDIYSLNYYEGYGNSIEDEDEDFKDTYDDDYQDEYCPRSSNKKGTSKRNKKTKSAKTIQNENKIELKVNNENSTDLLNKNENKKAKAKSKKNGDEVIYNTGVYTSEEEDRFLKGISLFGREWKKLTEYVMTRNSHSVRSHAQKYFIKLYRDGLPLPDKVRETGEGYTLSGKTLDPNSASAKPYLSNVNVEKINSKIAKYIIENAIDKKKTENNDSLLTEDQNVNDIKCTKNTKKNNSNSSNTKEINKSKTEQGQNKKDEKNVIKGKTQNNNSTNNHKGSTNQVRSKSNSPKFKKQSENINLYGEDGRTFYSKQRPKRSATRSITNYMEFMDSSNPLTMVKCESYYGVPGSGTHGCQPFSIIVNPIALAIMDLHSHLMNTEIIGLLAGEWNAQEKKLYVKSAFPCKSIDDNNSEDLMNRHVNVEMDPVSELEIRTKISEVNMKVVGWYHSHPKFAPDPSFVDIENQLNYQTLFREENCGIDEPFVGVIVGPYDPRLPRSYSAVNWFYVNNNKEEFGHPKHLVTKTEWKSKEDELIPENEFEKMKKLINSYKNHSDRHNFSEFWKHGLEETKLEKLLKSISYQLGMLKNHDSYDNTYESNKNKQIEIEGEVKNNNENTNSNSIETKQDENNNHDQNITETSKSMEIDKNINTDNEDDKVKSDKEEMVNDIKEAENDEAIECNEKEKVTNKQNGFDTSDVQTNENENSSKNLSENTILNSTTITTTTADNNIPSLNNISTTDNSKNIEGLQLLKMIEVELRQWI